MADELWPQDFRAVVELAFDGPLNRTAYGVVNRRVVHAFDVWRTRYTMTPEQHLYAWTLLAWAVSTAFGRASEQIAAGDVRHPQMYLRHVVAREMEDVVHNPVAHEGFKRRAGYVSVMDQLKELVA